MSTRSSLLSRSSIAAVGTLLATMVASASARACPSPDDIPYRVVEGDDARRITKNNYCLGGQSLAEHPLATIYGEAQRRAADEEREHVWIVIAGNGFHVRPGRDIIVHYAWPELFRMLAPEDRKLVPETEICLPRTLKLTGTVMLHVCTPAVGPEACVPVVSPKQTEQARPGGAAIQLGDAKPLAEEAPSTNAAVGAVPDEGLRARDQVALRNHEAHEAERLRKQRQPQLGLSTATIATGGVAVIIGAAFGGVAAAKKSDVENCLAAGGPCPNAQRTRSEYDSDRGIAQGLLVVGASAVIAGAIWLAVTHRRSAAKQVGTRGNLHGLQFAFR